MTGNTEFALHPRLAADTLFVADWSLSRVLLMNDARYHWIVLVPRRVGLCELHDVAVAERGLLGAEMMRASAGLKVLSGAAKINVGALGNLGPQLHIHVVARAPDDPAWPGPVWGHSPPEAYASSLAEPRIAALRAHL